MKSALSNRSLAAWQALALSSSFGVLAAPALAQSNTEQTLAPVTVSASRFETTEAPIGATVITAEQIREAGVGNVNEAIRKIGGVFGRQNFSGTSDYSLDLRGFGTNSDQNVAIFVDGIRISENELQPAMMSAIPIESVERIEIVRGGSSVLYGDGATGGTIQIITKRGAQQGTHGSIVTELGSHGHEEVRASATKAWDGWSLDANLGSLRTDNYRDNNELRQRNFSGGVQWAAQDVRVGLRIDAAREDFGFPGSLTLSQFEQDPRQTLTPFDKGSLDSNRYTLFARQRYGNWEAAADLSYREKTSKSTFASYGFASDAESAVTQFSPRLKYSSSSGAVKNEVVVGTDFSDSSRYTKSSYGGFANPDQDAKQESAAIYVRDEMRLDKLRVAAGVRHEQFEQQVKDLYDQTISLNAWDLQGNYEITPQLSLFGKIGRSYRIANVDDNAYLLAPLKPQRSNDLEFGSTIGNEDRKLTARVFRHRLKDEILYDPFLFQNVNLDPTQRQGIELEGRMRLSRAFVLSGVLQHVSAKFVDGPYDGKEMVLVPKNIATLRLNWEPGNGQTADVGVQWVDSQRNGNDFANSCNSRIPSFATLDARYAVRVGTWEFAVAGSNLTNKDYYTYAFGNCGNERGIYPDAGRAIRISARTDF
jgi:iron complex outermembrane receptor protein